MKVLYFRWPRLALGLAAATVLFALALLLPIRWDAAAPAAQGKRLLPIYSVATDQPLVAISFDASWGAEHTPELLDILDAQAAKATFFLVNIWLEDYPDMAREITARGHEIGLHSVSHPHFSALQPEEMRKELSDNFLCIQQTTGYCPTLFRPPFGDYNDELIETCAELGLTAVMWSKDSLDWRDLSAEEIAARVLKNVHPGDILLFHNNGTHTAEALPLVFSGLAELGLGAVPVGELLWPENFYIDANGVQHSRAEPIGK